MLWDTEAALAAAIGEAAERYCGNLVPPDLTEASYRELRADYLDTRVNDLLRLGKRQITTLLMLVGHRPEPGEVPADPGGEWTAED